MEEQNRELRDLVEAGKKDEAIIQYCQRFGVDRDRARDAIEAWSEALERRKQVQEPSLTSISEGQNPTRRPWWKRTGSKPTN